MSPIFIVSNSKTSSSLKLDNLPANGQASSLAKAVVFQAMLWIRGTLFDLSFEESLTAELVASDSHPWPYSSWTFVLTGWRMNPGWGTSSSLRLSLLSLVILFFSVALVLPLYEVLPYVLDVLILCLWGVFYPLGFFFLGA